MASNEVGSAYIKVSTKLDDSALSSQGASSGSKYGGDFSSAAQSKMQAGAVAMGNILADAAKAAAQAIGSLIGDTFSQYADYEQLVGGVDTLFKESSAIVQKNAAIAYRTTGQSANEYMQQVTSFSASLLQGLGGDTEAAAAYADMAMRDMSDNANKMGTDMESITNAYQGFAKQNYTMLDNLKLGYGGTKSEMERLLADASEIAGVEFDIDNYQDVIQAIHVMQESMDITGTTAKEASSTISGSLNSAQASFKNLLTGILDENADLGALGEQFLASVGDLLANVAPRIATLFENVVLGLPDALARAFELLPTMLAPAIIAVFGDEVGHQITDAMYDGFDGLQGVFDGVGQAFGMLQGVISPVIDTIGTIITTAVPLWQSAFQGVYDFLSANMMPFIQSIVDFITPIVEGITSLIEANLPTIAAIVQTAQEAIGTVVNAVWPVVQSTINTVVSSVQSFMQTAWPTIQGAITTAMTTIRGIIDTVWPHVQTLIQSTMAAVQAVISVAWPVIEGIMSTVMGAIEGVVSAVWPTIQGIIEGAVNAITSIIDGISSVVSGVTSTFNSIKEAMTNPIETAKGLIQSAIDTISGIFSGAHLELPEIKLPHFNIDGGEVPWGIGGKGSPPSISIDWYAKGGIVDGAQLIGAGEAGPEMILPKKGGLMDDFSEAVASKDDDALLLIRWLSRNLGPTIADYAPSMTRRDFDRMARGAMA